MARADILVINPNSNPAVTAGLDGALGTLRFADGPSIRCATLSEGPFGNADVIFLMGARFNWIFHFGQPPRYAKDEGHPARHCARGDRP